MKDRYAKTAVMRGKNVRVTNVGPRKFQWSENVSPSASCPAVLVDRTPVKPTYETFAPVTNGVGTFANDQGTFVIFYVFDVDRVQSIRAMVGTMDDEAKRTMLTLASDGWDGTPEDLIFTAKELTK